MLSLRESPGELLDVVSTLVFVHLDHNQGMTHMLYIWAIDRDMQVNKTTIAPASICFCPCIHYSFVINYEFSISHRRKVTLLLKKRHHFLLANCLIFFKFFSGSMVSIFVNLLQDSIYIDDSGCSLRWKFLLKNQYK